MVRVLFDDLGTTFAHTVAPDTLGPPSFSPPPDMSAYLRNNSKVKLPLSDAGEISKLENKISPPDFRKSRRVLLAETELPAPAFTAVLVIAGQF